MSQQTTDDSSSTSSDSAFSNLISKEDATNLVKVAISPEAELVAYEICPYSKEKLGFSGSHLKLTLESRESGSDGKSETRSFFVKALPLHVAIQADYASESGTFLKETEFFREVMPLMLKNYKGEAWAPECYLVKGRHALVFDDLGARGFSNRAKFFDEHCVLSAAASVARLHASSLLAEELLNGKSLIELYPNTFEESEYRRTGRNYEWFIPSVDYLIQSAKEMGLDSSRLSEVCHRVFDISVPSKTKRNVLSHGDLWSNNIIFDNANRCRLVDFQLMRYAPIAHDPMLLLYMCTSREFREEKGARVIDHYYECLRETLKFCGYRGQVPSYEELKQGIEEQRLPALIVAAINFHMILMAGDEVAEIMNDPETSEIYFFKERKPFVDKIMARNPVYEKRVKDITREMVEMSLRSGEFPELT